MKHNVIPGNASILTTSLFQLTMQRKVEVWQLYVSVSYAEDILCHVQNRYVYSLNNASVVILTVWRVAHEWSTAILRPY